MASTAPRSIAAAVALLALTGGLGAAVVLGPLGLGVIEWRISANSLNQMS